MGMTREPDGPRFAAALSDLAAPDKAIQDVCNRCLEQLGGSTTWAAAFVSAAWRDAMPEIANFLARRLQTTNIVGCTAESLVGTRRELEWQPGVSLLAARLPHPPCCFALKWERTLDGGTFVGWPDVWTAEENNQGTVLILADPFSFPVDYLLEQLAEDHPALKAAGGMASGAASPGESRLLCGTQVQDCGAVVTYFPPHIALRHVVSQGCRPIGRPFIITRAERQLIYELGGRPALAQLQAIFDELPTCEKELLRQGLHLGRVINEYQERFEPGDFLIRNVLGADASTGALVVADDLRVGQTVQFHVRDHSTANAELRQLLAGVRASHPRAALLFTCNGRGTRMFPAPHHDAQVVHDLLGAIPLAGFFAQGEIGPVGSRNFVHGFTASLLLFADGP